MSESKNRESRNIDKGLASPASIDSNLDKLEEKVSNTSPFGYKVENGAYKLSYGDVILETPFSDPKVLIKVAELTSKILSIYKNNKAEGDFFQRESYWTRGDSDPFMLLQLDDAFLKGAFDGFFKGNGTTYLTEDGYLSVFLPDDMKEEMRILGRSKKRKDIMKYQAYKNQFDPNRRNGLIQAYANFLNSIKDSFEVSPTPEKIGETLIVDNSKQSKQIIAKKPE